MRHQNSCARENVAILRACVVFVLILVAYVVAPAADGKRAAVPGEAKGSARDRVAAYLDWFPADTESLVVAHGPFQFPQRLPLQRNKKGSFEELFQAVALSPLVWIKREKYLVPLAGQTVLTSIEGIKDFRAEPDRGHKEYEYSGCHVLVFQKDLGAAGDALWKLLQTDASSKLTLEGLEVVVIETSEMKPLPKKLLIARPRENILLCATTEAMLNEIVSRMAKNSKSNALPATLPEWKQLDGEVSYWALRHYDPIKGPSDTSSALWTSPHTGEALDPDAIGKVLRFDRNANQIATFSYLSGNVQSANRALKDMIQALPVLGFGPNSAKMTYRNCPELVFDVSSPVNARLTLQLFLSTWAHNGWL